MSPDGQKALIAGGVTAYGCEHFKMERDRRDFRTFPCPDVFELDLTSMCWVQACDLPAPSINFHASRDVLFCKHSFVKATGLCFPHFCAVKV